MKISYDEEIDACYIRLREKGEHCRTIEMKGILRDIVLVDVDKGDNVIGIEILGFDEKEMSDE